MTTFPVKSPCSGPVTVETLSGGRNEPSMTFSYVQDSEEGSQRKSSESLILAKKDKKGGEWTDLNRYLGQK